MIIQGFIRRGFGHHHHHHHHHHRLLPQNAPPTLFVCTRRQKSSGQPWFNGEDVREAAPPASSPQDFGLKERRGEWRSSESWQDCIYEHSLSDIANNSKGRKQPAPPRLQSSLGDPNRYWVQSPTASSLPYQERFVLMSYSILSTFTIDKWHRLLFRGVPEHILSWNYRRELILRDIQLCSPDVICLQEVDKFEDLQKELQLRGYEGVYKERTGESKEGCATFWRKNGFHLLQEESIAFQDFGLRDNVAQLCVLKFNNKEKPDMETDTIHPGETMDNSRCVVVGNIHVLFNPKRGEIKLGQLRLFLERAYALSNAWSGAPLILGGNFNITPTSGIYKFLTTAKLDVSGFDRKYLSGLSEIDPSSWRIWKIPNTTLQDSRRTKTGIHTQHMDDRASSRNRSGTLKEVPDSSLETAEATPESDSLAAAYTFDDTEKCVGRDRCNEHAYKSTLQVEDCMKSVKKEGNIDYVEPDKTLAEDCGPSINSQSEDTLANENIAKVEHNPVYDDTAETNVQDPSPSSESTETILENKSSNQLSYYEWSKEELESATGNGSCVIAQHKLNLHSVYADIHGPSFTRDVNQEPVVTYCNKKFQGTVDYLWYSEGLQPLRVLDGLPMHVLRSTRGLPSSRWPSDHLALACELAFTGSASASLEKEVEDP